MLVQLMDTNLMDLSIYRLPNVILESEALIPKRIRRVTENRNWPVIVSFILLRCT